MGRAIDGVQVNVKMKKEELMDAKGARRGGRGVVRAAKQPKRATGV